MTEIFLSRHFLTYLFFFHRDSIFNRFFPSEPYNLKQVYSTHNYDVISTTDTLKAQIQFVTRK